MTGSEWRHDLCDLVRIFAGISGPTTENATVDVLQVPPPRRQRLCRFVKIGFVVSFTEIIVTRGKLGPARLSHLARLGEHVRVFPCFQLA